MSDIVPFMIIAFSLGSICTSLVWFTVRLRQQREEPPEPPVSLSPLQIRQVLEMIHIELDSYQKANLSRDLRK